jgi:hypothetical protein
MALWWPTLSKAVPANFRKEFNSLVVLVSRKIWLERNMRIFDKVHDYAEASVWSLCDRIQRQFELWKSARICEGGPDRGVM